MIPERHFWHRQGTLHHPQEFPADFFCTIKATSFGKKYVVKSHRFLVGRFEFQRTSTKIVSSIRTGQFAGAEISASLQSLQQKTSRQLQGVLACITQMGQQNPFGDPKSSQHFDTFRKFHLMSSSFWLGQGLSNGLPGVRLFTDPQMQRKRSWGHVFLIFGGTEKELKQSEAAPHWIQFCRFDLRESSVRAVPNVELLALDWRSWVTPENEWFSIHFFKLKLKKRVASSNRNFWSSASSFFWGFDYFMSG